MIGNELKSEEVFKLKEYTKVYVEYENNRYASGIEFVVHKKNEIGTQNKWGTVNLVKKNSSIRYFEVN